MFYLRLHLGQKSPFFFHCAEETFPSILGICSMFCLFLKNIYLSLERGEGRERGREILV